MSNPNEKRFRHRFRWAEAFSHVFLSSGSIRGTQRRTASRTGFRTADRHPKKPEDSPPDGCFLAPYRFPVCGPAQAGHRHRKRPQRPKTRRTEPSKDSPPQTQTIRKRLPCISQTAFAYLRIGFPLPFRPVSESSRFVPCLTHGIPGRGEHSRSRSWATTRPGWLP